jgi:predicted dehydrogenase
MSVTRSVKVALVGYGHLGRWHLDKAMAFDYVEVVGVVDPAPDTQDKLKERGHDVLVYKDLDSIIDKIDAAIVVAPTSLHFSLVEKLLLSDKHVFCEKPMTSTYEQALILKEIQSERKKVFQVGHSERFHESWELLKKNKDNYLGQDSFLSIERQAAFKGRALDVDVVQDLMIHDLDLTRYLYNEDPISIKAYGYKIRTKHWDYVRADLSYASGRTAQIISGRNYTHEVRSLDLMSKQGAVHVDLMSCDLSFAPFDSRDEHVLKCEYEKRDHLYEEQKCFFDSILNEREVVVNIDDGMAAVHLVSKVLESLESNTVVKVGEF